MTSARSLSFGMPAKPIAVPGMSPFGLAMNLFSSSMVQVPPLAFIAAEKLKPRPSPRWSSTMPKRFGPTRFGPPFSKVWHSPHFLAAEAPFSTEAVWSSFSMGSEGAAAAAPSLPWPASSFTAISKPGFSGILGENSAWAVKLVTSRMRQVPSTAPRILFSSKESISGQAPHRKKENSGRTAARTSLGRIKRSLLFPRVLPLRYRFARGLATRISDPAFGPSPFHFPTRKTSRFQALEPMTDPRILVLIPARMAATRLPGKPLADIAGLPMIVHVMRRAEAAGIGRVAVATDTAEIAAVVTAHGGEAVMTRPEHPSGSDRIHEAMQKLDPDGKAEIVVNLQGDFPTITIDNIREVLPPLEDPAVDIATLASQIHTEEEDLAPSVVKAIGTSLGVRRMRALYFTRATAPTGDGPRYHHIGLYAYRRAALERFVSLPPSPLELQEKLEQLRALEAGMRIDFTIVDTVPRGVDTPADLETARGILSKS